MRERKDRDVYSDVSIRVIMGFQQVPVISCYRVPTDYGKLE